MHVIGRTGTGKTRFLEHLIRQDILNNQGLCLIDPTGNLYHDLVRWCETHHLTDTKRIVLFDVSADGVSFGFNPLRCDREDAESLSFAVNAMTNACQQAWGGEDMNQFPLLARTLPVLLHTLMEHGLTLLEALYLTNPDRQESVRAYLSRNVQDPAIRAEWGKFNQLSLRDFDNQFLSTSNRLFRFLKEPRIRRILGQTNHVVDFGRIMDEGHILLVNFSSAGHKLHKDSARLLGTLFVNDLVCKARLRPRGSRPFYLYIDECHRYLNDDISEILDEMRQFGLHLVLSHQHLEQLRKASEAIYGSVMGDARTKVIFNVRQEDAAILAKEIFMGEIDYEEPKHILDKPVVVGHRKERFSSASHGRSLSQQQSQSQRYGTGESQTTGRSEPQTEFLEQLMGQEKGRATFTDSHTTSSSYDHSSSVSEGVSLQEIEGWSEGLVPELAVRPGGLHSLEEQYDRAAARLGMLPDRRAIVKIHTQRSLEIKVPDIVEGYANKERVKRLTSRIFRQCGFAIADEQAEAELMNRRRRLEEAARQVAQGAKEEPESFLE